jgi:hypothetical protein
VLNSYLTAEAFDYLLFKHIIYSSVLSRLRV